MSLARTIPVPYRLWLKAKLLGMRKRFVRAFRSYDAPRLLAALRALGVEHGDSVMLHSAFSDAHGFRGSIEQLTNVFIDAVGPEGHLLMVSLPYRSSTFEYLKKMKVFDVRKTPSMMGMVSEMFRRRPDVIRSLHPSHPVLVRGERAEWFVADHPACRYACGPGSPFDKLAQTNGMAVFFNVEFATFTFFHHLEHLVSAQLPFPLYTAEPFDAHVIDRHGRPHVISTYAFAPEAMARRRFEVLERAVRRRGLIREVRVGNSRILAVRVRDTIECVLQMGRDGEFFYDRSDLPLSAEPASEAPGRVA